MGDVGTSDDRASSKIDSTTPSASPVRPSTSIRAWASGEPHETYASHMVLIWREQGRLERWRRSSSPSWRGPSIRAQPSCGQRLPSSARRPRRSAGLLGSDPVPRSRTSRGSSTCASPRSSPRRPDSRADKSCTRSCCHSVTGRHDGCHVHLHGCSSYYLGMLAASLGHHDEAQGHLDHAVALNERIGAIPWSRRARARRHPVRRHPGAAGAPAVTALMARSCREAE